MTDPGATAAETAAGGEKQAGTAESGAGTAERLAEIYVRHAHETVRQKEVLFGAILFFLFFDAMAFFYGLYMAAQAILVHKADWHVLGIPFLPGMIGAIVLVMATRGVYNLTEKEKAIPADDVFPGGSTMRQTGEAILG